MKPQFVLLKCKSCYPDVLKNQVLNSVNLKYDFVNFFLQLFNETSVYHFAGNLIATRLFIKSNKDSWIILCYKSI